MKLIIAGKRDYYVDDLFIDRFLDHFGIPENSAETFEIVSGGASGIDSCGEQYASWLKVPVKLFPAQWSTLGLKAGPIRNAQMAEYADALLLIWDGESRGSASMKREMQKRGKPIFEVILRKS